MVISESTIIKGEKAMENNRDSFGSNFGFIMAAVGSAVGLGNIWGFPYKISAYGGFAFLLVYLALGIFVGLAVMVGEFVIGRKTGLSPIAAYRKLSKKFTWLGYMAVICPFLVLCFYFVLGGMVMRYAAGYLTAIFGWDTWGVSNIADFFGSFIMNGGQMILWTAIFIVLNVAIVAGGIGEGIEKFCKVGMPALFVMLIIIIIYVACQPGAGEGYKFIFGWDLSPLKEDWLLVLKSAAGQMFFSLALGMGAMITYGSYLQKKESVQKNALIVVISDTTVAIMAAMVVVPACFAFLGTNAGAGPGLLFKSMQEVFHNMGYVGNIMGFLFYTLVFIAAITSSISLLEVITAYKVDKNVEQGKAPGRKKYAILAACIIFIFCLPTCLDGLGAGINGGAAIGTPAEILGMSWGEAGDITEFAEDTAYYVKGDDGIYTAVADDAAFDASETYYLKTAKTWNGDWLDFYDVLSEGIMMPLGAMVMAFLIGWVLKLDFVVEECESSGHRFWGKTFFNICYKVITPLGMILVLYGQITSFF